MRGLHLTAVRVCGLAVVAMFAVVAVGVADRITGWSLNAGLDLTMMTALVVAAVSFAVANVRTGEAAWTLALSGLSLLCILLLLRFGRILVAQGGIRLDSGASQEILDLAMSAGVASLAAHLSIRAWPVRSQGEDGGAV